MKFTPFIKIFIRAHYSPERCTVSRTVAWKNFSNERNTLGNWRRWELRGVALYRPWRRFIGVSFSCFFSSLILSLEDRIAYSTPPRVNNRKASSNSRLYGEYFFAGQKVDLRIEVFLCCRARKRLLARYTFIIIETRNTLRFAYGLEENYKFSLRRVSRREKSRGTTERTTCWRGEGRWPMQCWPTSWRLEGPENVPSRTERGYHPLLIPPCLPSPHII